VSSDSSEEEEEVDDGWDVWQPDTPSPPQGGVQSPPSQWVCGDHPGAGWEVNDLLTRAYYRILIPNPVTNHLIVTPYVTYAIQNDHAKVSGTYGHDHSIHTQVLQPIPVDYYCPLITPSQLAVLDPDSPFTDTVNKIINKQLPLHLSAAV
jgi:hypothetical protein